MMARQDGRPTAERRQNREFAPTAGFAATFPSGRKTRHIRTLALPPKRGNHDSEMTREKP
jgi:hypothetical protein